jgi:hypothetical protein
VKMAILGLLLLSSAMAAQEPRDEVLPNGIRLPRPWPPKADVTKDLEIPPYLQSPPSVIPIDLGRQLFVDDFLVEATTLKRTFRRATYHPACPVLRPDRPWEAGVAMAFSDGCWYDPKDRLFKMWYLTGKDHATCYATSEDGIRWTKPELDVKPGTNVVQTGARDSSTVWLDQEEKDPKRRFKMFRSSPGGSTVPKAFGLATFFSEDGIHWSEKPMLTGSCGDRSTVFWNPFRKVWVYSIRHGWGEPRRRRYWERTDLEGSSLWEQLVEAPLWIGADRLDPERPEYKVPCQLYNLDGVAYESIILGLFTIWRGQFPDRQKPNEITLGYSRDGWHWTRPDRRPFCPVSDKQGEWNANNVQSVGGGCLVVGDSLYFYVSGRAGEAGSARQGVCSTGLAVLRRDGFASMDAPEGEGTLTTRPVRFSGKHLFVNLAAPRGELRVEVLDETGVGVLGSAPLSGDGTLLPVAWPEGSGLGGLAGKTVKFRFRLKGGSLYSFWVSPDLSGSSQGYVAAGGPGFTGPTDTVGRLR